MRNPAEIKTSGFTLVEILVALFIFAIVGLMGTQLISRVTNQQAILTERGARLIELQRAMNILKRDVMQIVGRGIRDELGDRQPAIVLDDDDLFEFTRTGWRNPLGQARSDLQRVAYGLDDETQELRRYYWSELDRAQDSEPIMQTLLTDVGKVEFAVVDQAGNLHSFWPQVSNNNQSVGVFIVAVVIRIDARPFGLLERIWEVAGG